MLFIIFHIYFIQTKYSFQNIYTNLYISYAHNNDFNDLFSESSRRNQQQQNLSLLTYFKNLFSCIWIYNWEFTIIMFIFDCFWLGLKQPSVSNEQILSHVIHYKTWYYCEIKASSNGWNFSCYLTSCWSRLIKCELLVYLHG